MRPVALSHYTANSLPKRLWRDCQRDSPEEGRSEAFDGTGLLDPPLACYSLDIF